MIVRGFVTIVYLRFLMHPHDRCTYDTHSVNGEMFFVLTLFKSTMRRKHLSPLVMVCNA